MTITVAFFMVTCIAMIYLDFNIFLNEAFGLTKKLNPRDLRAVNLLNELKDRCVSYLLDRPKSMEFCMKMIDYSEMMRDA